MEELVVNLHIHTLYSDGIWPHKKIAEAGIQAGLDALVITDHNILVKDLKDIINPTEKKYW